jgi:hypothetical protein
MTVCFSYIHNACTEPCPAGRDHVDICGLRHDPAAAGCGLYHLSPAECADYQLWLDTSFKAGPDAAPDNFCRDFANGRCDRGESCRYPHVARAERGRGGRGNRGGDRGGDKSAARGGNKSAAPAQSSAGADTPAGHLAIARKHIQQHAALAGDGYAAAVTGGAGHTAGHTAAGHTAAGHTAAGHTTPRGMSNSAPHTSPHAAANQSGRTARGANLFDSILDEVGAAVAAGQPLADLESAGADARLLLRGEPAADYSAAGELVALGLRVPTATAAMVAALRAFLAEVAGRPSVRARAEKAAATAAAFARLLSAAN